MKTVKCSKVWAWWIPAVLALVSALGMWGAYELMFAMRVAADISGEGMDTGLLVMLSFWLLVLVFVYCLVWLVVSIVICVQQRCWWSLLGRLFLVLVAWSVWSGCLLFMFMLWVGGGPNPFADDLQLPPGRELVCPRGMDGVYVVPDDARAARVRELCALRPRLPEPVATPAESLALPNTEKLAREAPELLHLYVLRSLYAEAVNPRFFSAILYAHQRAYLWHAASPEMYPYWEEGESQSEIDLGNGWKWRYADAVDAQGDAARLEAELAPLAQNPSMAPLDAMLPPVPELPFLSLRNGWAVASDYELSYGALLVVPESYPLGKFTLKAYETTKRKHIRFDNVNFENGEEKSCSWNMRVYSGREGQYYGSIWEIWFTPAEGGESRCVATQEFLMMGN